MSKVGAGKGSRRAYPVPHILASLTKQMYATFAEPAIIVWVKRLYVLRETIDSAFVSSNDARSHAFLGEYLTFCALFPLISLQRRMI